MVWMDVSRCFNASYGAGMGLAVVAIYGEIFARSSLEASRVPRGCSCGVDLLHERTGTKR